MASDYTDSFAGDPYFIHKGEQLSAAGMTAALNTKEKVANKTDTLSNSSTEYPSTKAVYDSLNEKDNNAVHKTGNETITGIKTFGTASAAAEPLLGLAKTADAADNGVKFATEAQVYKKQDKLTAEQLSLLASLSTLSFFPRGTILTFNKDAWDAKDNNFKQIWKVCDGTNGTPDLKNRFLRGAEYPAGNYNGADSVKLAKENLPKHAHTINDPGHTHSYTRSSLTINADYHGIRAGNPTSATTDNSKTGISVNDTFPNQSEYAKAFSVVPSYYTVIYIMKIA